MADVVDDGRGGSWADGVQRMITSDWPTVGAAVLGLAGVVEAVARGGQPANVALALVLALAMTAPVALGREQPALAALLIMTACLVALVSGDKPTVAGIVAAWWMVYRAGRTSSRRTVVLLAVPLAACVVAAFYQRTTFAALIIVGVGMAAGTVRRLRVDAESRDATVQEMTDTLVEHVARGERARIARELHDVVAHHISMIALEAEAARLATVGMPPDGAKRLQTIGDTARSALSEMRHLLGVLREDAAAERDLRPQPGLQQLNELLDASRSLAGGSARLIVQGQVRPLSPGVELTTYRIVQEALTNVRRHAPGAGVDVELNYGPEALRLRVRDNGPGGAPEEGSRSGHGLTGMRERAAMLGGSLTAGPGRLDGFVVEAVLPLTPEHAEERS